MSDMNNGSRRDFSYYDLMETEELEEILRLDAEAPEGEESDLELILYVMEVLADRRKKSGKFTGKTAEEAYESFIQNYLPEVEVHECHQQKNRGGIRIHSRWLKRMTAAAAMFAIVFFGSITASAFGFDAWKIVATWAKETFSLSTEDHADESAPVGDNKLPYTSLQEAIDSNFSNPIKVPTLLTEGYELVGIDIHENPVQKRYIAIYDNGVLRFKISVQSYLVGRPEQMEQSEGFVEIYALNGIDYYLFSNLDTRKAAWIDGSSECYISGELTIDELKAMIDSIGKG